MKSDRLKRLLQRIIISLLLVPFFGGCDYSYLEISELPDYEYTSEWVLPLLKSKMNINSLFIDSDNQSVIIDNDDLVWLIYQGELTSINGSDEFNIPNQSYNFDFSYNGTFKDKATFIQELSFTPQEDEDVRKIIFQSGQMSISALCPQLVIEGVQLQIVGTILNSDNGSGSPITFAMQLSESANIDLAGKVLNFTAGQTLSIQIDVTIISGTPSSPPYTINFSNQFLNMDFFEMQGYFKQRSFTLGADDVDLGFFKNVVDGEIFFEDPVIELDADNSYGIPIDVHFDAFFSSYDANIVDVTGNPIPDNPWRINAPTIINPGTIVNTHYDITKFNSNIHDVIEIMPKKVSYNIRGETNPDGNTELNHIRRNSQFKVGVTVNLPLHGWLKLAGFRDTMDFALPEVESIEYLELVINTVNSIPVSSFLQMDAFDADYNFLKTVLRGDQALILAADVDYEGNVLSETRATTSIRIEKEELEDIKDVAYLIFRAKITSFGDGQRNIKIFSHNELNVYVGVKAGIKHIIDL
jgi:hypothetical protein